MINNIALWASVLLMVLPAAVSGQEALAGRVVKDSFAPKPSLRRPLLDLGNFAGAEAPAGAEAVALQIRGVQFEGDPCPHPQSRLGATRWPSRV